MKKIIIVLLLFIGVFAFSEEYTKEEKNIILTQFVEFQNAIKTGDIDVLNEMINYPLEGYSAKYAFYLVNNETVNKEEVIENKERFIKDMQEMLLLKVNLKNNTVKSYAEGNHYIVKAEFVDYYITSERVKYKSKEKLFQVSFRDIDGEESNSDNYYFILENNVLKLIKIFGAS